MKQNKFGVLKTKTLGAMTAILSSNPKLTLLGLGVVASLTLSAFVGLSDGGLQQHTAAAAGFPCYFTYDWHLHCASN
jgi:hypothetical protein